METEFSMSISATDYKEFEKLENLTGDECYKKYGLKREEGIGDTFRISNNYEIWVRQLIPYDTSETTYACATLHDIENDTYAECEDVDDTILGQWEFCLDDDTTITVDIGVHED